MCGISGFFDSDGRTVDAAVLERMGRAMEHRGPDHFGTFYERFVGFAHNRLSLMDLSSRGHQPFENNNYVLICNGEIYNYLELKDELMPLGVEFRSTSDVEALFWYLIHFGIEATLAKIRGMFAFAFYDHRNYELTLARDRIGIKPLFYAYQGYRLYFASEMKAILAATRLELDPVKALYSAAGILEKSRRHTVFRDVQHVEPGTYVTLAMDDRGPVVHKYFQLTDYLDEASYRRLDAAGPAAVTAEMDHRFGAAVRSMLMSDAPMGAFVSGGIDSSLIAAYAAEENPQLELFSADVVGRHSEAEDARALARAVDRPLHTYEFKPEMLVRDWVRATWHYESPIVVHTNAVPFLNVAATAREHGIKAVLTGEGSDELFLGYPKLLTRRYRQLLALPFELLKRLYALVPGLAGYVLESPGGGLLADFELLVQHYERQRLRRDGLERLDFLPPKARQGHYLTLQLMNEGIVSLLWRNDRMGMASSIEARFPFLDEELVRFAVNLPEKYKIGRTNRFHNYKHPFLIDKAIVRRLAAGRLPDRLVHKKKNGFPMYGFHNLRLRPGFFDGGFWQEVHKLSTAETAYMEAHTRPYHLAKLAAVDIWGKLFVMGQDREQVAGHVADFVSVET